MKHSAQDLECGECAIMQKTVFERSLGRHWCLVGAFNFAAVYNISFLGDIRKSVQETSFCLELFVCFSFGMLLHVVSTDLSQIRENSDMILELLDRAATKKLLQFLCFHS